MNRIISVKNVSKIYRIPKNEKGFFNGIKGLLKRDVIEKVALKDVSFDITEGEVVAYIGPNGAGKSTTIKLLTGLLLPTSGHISVKGQDPFQYRKQLAQMTGVLMGQRSNLWWDLPLQDSYDLLRVIYNLDKKTYKEWSQYLIETMGIEDLLSQPVRMLSLGQRMKAEIVSIFIPKPEIVYLDEPTIGLDVVTKQKVIEFLMHINKQFHTTIILTTHDLQDVEKLCKRMILIDKSILKYDGTVSNFIKKYGNMKRVMIKSDSDNVPQLPNDFTLSEQFIDGWEFIYDQSRYKERDVLAMIAKLENVTSVSFKDPDLSLIIKNMFREDFEHVWD